MSQVKKYERSKATPLINQLLHRIRFLLLVKNFFFERTHKKKLYFSKTEGPKNSLIHLKVCLFLL